MAQPTTDPNQRATELYKKGNEFYDKGKFADAETMYRAAFELRQSFEIAGNLGDVEMIQGKPREAAEHLALALREFPPSGKPAQKEALRKRLRDAASLIGTVKVTVSAPEAEILIDDKPLGKSPIEREIYVDRGDHVIEARLAGHEPAKEKITATTGSTHDVSLTLKKIEAPKPPPKPVEPVETGSDAPKKKNVIIIIGGAMVSVAAVATGIGLTVAANSASDDALAQRKVLFDRKAPFCNAYLPSDNITADQCKALHEALSDKDSYTNTAVVAYVIGGLAAAGTAVYALWPAPKNRKSTVVRPVPVVTGREGGLWITGTF
jgi:tetratricopeptide (TPR) repeat protein